MKLIGPPIDPDEAKELAGEILAEFGIQLGTMAGISETGIHLDLDQHGAGLITIELIGLINADQYERLFKDRHRGGLPE
jgi:hypothetical protein